jgi:hypothetical protein
MVIAASRLLDIAAVQRGTLPLQGVNYALIQTPELGGMPTCSKLPHLR